MSETPRIYSSSGSRFSISARRRRGNLIRVAVSIIAVALLYAFWISRDTYPMEHFVAARPEVQVIVPRASATRQRVAASRVWDGIPEGWLPFDMRETFSDTHGLPDWMMSNLLGGDVLVNAQRLGAHSEYVAVSRMTRIGAIIERMMRLSPGSTRDWAGGLNVRHWEASDLFYAARGRTLIASPSRDALIAALTLGPAQRMEATRVRNALETGGAEDVRGTLHPRGEGSATPVVDTIRFAARITQNEALLKVELDFSPELTADLAPYLDGISPQPLPDPFEGPVAVSANLGMPVERLWAALGEVATAEWLSREQWRAWRAGDASSAEAMLTQVLGPMGPEMRVTWTGIDIEEMAPTPILVGSLEARMEDARETLERLARNRVSPESLEARVRYDAETGRIDAPLMSGPAMAPTGEWTGELFRFCTHGGTADPSWQGAEWSAAPLNLVGNLYVRLDPSAFTHMIVRAGRDLAEEGLVRGYTRESYAEASARWLERASVISTAEVLVERISPEGLSAEIRVECAVD